MTTSTIQREAWEAFFPAFSSLHSNQLVSLGVDGKQPMHDAVEHVAREMPLRDISVDLKERESTVVISLGLSQDKLLRHSIASVSEVRVVQSEAGTDSALEIETMNGQTTTLNLSKDTSHK
jgi:hypothetical protein